MTQDGRGDPVFGGVLSWLNQPGGFGQNWPTGLALLISGAIGASVLVYASESGRLPNVGGGTRLREARAEVDDLRSALATADSEWEELLARNAEGHRVALVERRCAFLRERLGAAEDEVDRRRRAVARKAPLYVLLGGVLACALAPTVTFAALIGLAWPAVLLGLATARVSADIRRTAIEALSGSVEDEKRVRQDSRSEGRTEALLEFAEVLQRAALHRVAAQRVQDRGGDDFAPMVDVREDNGARDTAE